MMTISRSIVLAASALALAGCSTTGTQTAPVASTASPPAAPQASAGAQAISLKAGQLVSLIAPDPHPDGAEARRIYGQRAFPLAGPLGLKQEATLAVTDNVIADYSPGAFVFYSWPNQAAEDRLNAHPDWPSIKALRPQAWNELKIFSAVLEEDLELTFSPDKYYTVAVAWTNPDNPDDYQAYLDGIESSLSDIGARYIYQMRNPRMEAHAAPPQAPDYVTLVEWDADNGFARLQATDGYKASAPNFRSGVRKIEFHQLISPAN